MTPLIITVASTGAELTKKNTPYVPVSPEEIIHEALEVYKLGASILHLHARDDYGNPTCDPKRINEIVDEIKKETDLILQISTGGALSDALEDRMRTLDTSVEMASLTLGSVNFGDDVFFNPIPTIKALAKKIKDKGIVPELEIFDTAMVERASELLEEGLLHAPCHFNIILGGPGWLSATPENVDFILKKLPPHSTWSGSGVGKHQLPMIEYAISHDGHVRTGLEDNIYLKKGVLAKNNAELVKQTLEVAKQYKRRIATVDEARKVLGIKKN